MPIFYLTQGGGRVQPGQSARAFLFQGDWASDLGRPDPGPGHRARRGGRRSRLRVRTGGRPPRLRDRDPRRRAVGAGRAARLAARRDGLAGHHPHLRHRRHRRADRPVAARAPVPAQRAGRRRDRPGARSRGYTGTINTAEPAFEGYVQVWVNEPEPRREVVVDYALGGGPGYRHSEGGYRRSDGGYRRSEGAPVMSPDGQVILFMNEESTGEDWFYTLQALPAPPQPPPWATVVGQAYRLSASQDAPDLTGASISVSYLGSEAPPGEEAWLRLYFWDGAPGSRWTRSSTPITTWPRLPCRGRASMRSCRRWRSRSTGRAGTCLPIPCRAPGR